MLDPEGAPVPSAKIQWNRRSSSGLVSGTAFTRVDGRHQFRTNARDEFELSVLDPHERWAGVAAHGVHMGAQELVLRFSASRTIEVTALDSHGVSVHGFTVEAWTSDENDRLSSASAQAGLGERAALLVPSEPFVVVVRAPLHAIGRLGPFAPGAAPDELAVQLASLTGIRGRALADGRGVPGALVQLQREAAMRVTHDGFPVRVDARSFDEVRTEADGSFALTVRDDGRWFVRVESAGFAPAEVGPLEVRQSVGAEGLEVALGSGGAIEGHVLVSPGHAAAGTIVGFSRGDAHALSVRADPDGSFRIERLMPGRWLVQQLELELVLGRGLSRMISGRWSELPWNCEVLEGRTTRFDLDLREQGVRATLAGQLSVADLGGSLAALCRGEVRGRQDSAERTVFKSVGTALEDLAAAMLVAGVSAR